MAILTEDMVVDAVCLELRTRGFRVLSQLTAVQRGEDIVAESSHYRLSIEAKGAGSSKEHSTRYGVEFNSSQVFDHVAKAILKALRIVSRGDARAGIALPDNAVHRREVEQVMAALHAAQIAVFWVDPETLHVRIDSPWDVT